MKTWPQHQGAKPYTPETWAKDPSKWAAWNHPRIEATFEYLAAEAATLPLAEASVLKLGDELQELRTEQGRVLHELKEAAKEVKVLRATAEAQRERLVGLELAREVSIETCNRALSVIEVLSARLDDSQAAIEQLTKAKAALFTGFYALREAVLSTDPTSKAAAEAGEVLMRNRVKG